MSKIKPYVLIESLSGKVCQHSDTYFTTRYGRTFSSRLCNPSTADPTQAQLERRAAFKEAVVKTRATMADKSSEDYHVAMAAFKSQKKYVTFYGYLIAQNLKG
ncbi:MAG: hypothetical protein MJZ01_08455 [Bacteroidales bacterium]|nr:hypothetical protein [Bacteroidales bacterium]